MTKRKYNNLFIMLTFGIYVVFYRIFLSVNTNSSVEFINAAILVMFAFLSIILFGFRKDRLNKLKKSILYVTIVEVLIFLFISYGLGFVTGFTQNAYAVSIPSIIGNVTAPIIFIIALEVFRYTVLSANSDDILVVYVTTTLIILLELTMGLNKVVYYDFETIFKTVSAIILPIIIKNASLSYLTIKGGLKPVLFYRLIMDIYMFILPIVPELGEYLTSVIGILLPTLVYMYSSRLVDEKLNKLDKEEKFSKKKIRVSDIPLTIFIIILVALISNKFTYSIIGVGSESMTPKIEKGDAVVFKKIKNEKELKVGDILVFNSGSRMIIHRLVEIKKDNGDIYYITKGDANNGTDNLNLTNENIEGKVIFKIKYIAWPSLWLKEKIDKE